jgi:protein-tyrosine-phosphatase
MLHILFVCTGNTCRSPLAEGMLRMMAQREQAQLEVRSAGVSAVDGAPISRNSGTILQELGFQGIMRSNTLAEENMNWAHVILTMTVNHKRTVIQRHPDAVDKVFTLKEFVEDDPHILAAIQQREQLAAEIQMKSALSQPISSEELSLIRRLEDAVPDYDISDPFGGSLDSYRVTASEIEQSLTKLLHKLRNGKSGL